jgi:hypothetical protein
MRKISGVVWGFHHSPMWLVFDVAASFRVAEPEQCPVRNEASTDWTTAVSVHTSQLFGRYIDWFGSRKLSNCACQVTTRHPETGKELPSGDQSLAAISSTVQCSMGPISVRWRSLRVVDQKTVPLMMHSCILLFLISCTSARSYRRKRRLNGRRYRKPPSAGQSGLA